MEDLTVVKRSQGWRREMDRPKEDSVTERDLTTVLIDRIKEMISSRQVNPGEKLPSERELAERFGVSRPSLRNALKVLEIMGVVSQKVGDGTYLNRDASQVLSVPFEFLFLMDETSMQDLVDIRLIIEPPLAARAAQWADAHEIEMLNQSLLQMEASEGDRVKMIEADLAFHRAIFDASGNRLAGRLFNSLHQIMLDIMVVTSQMSDPTHTLQFHRPIFKAIRYRKADDAARLMTVHLQDARKLLQFATRDNARS
jgi:GntR family transcriptional regulator, transcriptional repressor for pyruvate dehydrogenase complex